MLVLLRIIPNAITAIKLFSMTWVHPITIFSPIATTGFHLPPPCASCTFNSLSLSFSLRSWSLVDIWDKRRIKSTGN